MKVILVPKYLPEGRQRRQHTTDVDGDKWPVVYAPLKVTRHKTRQGTAHMMLTVMTIILIILL